MTVKHGDSSPARMGAELQSDDKDFQTRGPSESLRQGSMARESTLQGILQKTDEFS